MNLVERLRCRAKADTAPKGLSYENHIDWILVQAADRIEALEKQRDELLAALEGVLAWDKKRQFPIPYRVRDPIHAVIASVKGGAA